jgi:hypothetical protein
LRFLTKLESRTGKQKVKGKNAVSLRDEFSALRPPITTFEGRQAQDW